MKQNKYNIESNINFYEELNKKIDDNVNNDNICLITYEKLMNIHDTLDCGHSFNHVPLLKELLKQHKNVAKYKIKCPMCKCIHSQLLPLYIDDAKLININCRSIEDEYSQFIASSTPCTATECMSTIFTGKNKGNKCTVKKLYKENLCKRHYNIYYKT